MVKNPPVNAGDVDSIPASGRSSGEENGNSLQYSCLGNPMDRGAWQATVHGGHQRVRHDLATKQQRQQTRMLKARSGFHCQCPKLQMDGRGSQSCYIQDFPGGLVIKKLPQCKSCYFHTVQ